MLTINPAKILPINIPLIASINLNLNIEAIAAAVQVPVVGKGIPTKSIIPTKEAAFIFLILILILLSTLFNKATNILLSLKYCITCLYANTRGMATNVDPITLAIYTPIGFKSKAIPIGIAPLSSVIGTIDKNIILK